MSVPQVSHLHAFHADQTRRSPAADYLIVITKRTKVATVLGSAVYAASDFSVFPIDRSASNADLVKNPEESYLLGLVKSHLYSAPFYFTYGGYNVTTRLQEQQPPPSAADGDNNHSTASRPFWQTVSLCPMSWLSCFFHAEHKLLTTGTLARARSRTTASSGTATCKGASSTPPPSAGPKT